MSDLGDVVVAATAGYQLPAPRPEGGIDVETWLSFALEDQPFLPIEQNLLNRSAANVAISALGDLVVCRQHDVESPAWLMDLLTIWHGTRTEVITLNWDTLVEAATEASRLWSLSYPTSDFDNVSISSDDILDHVPRLAPGSPAGGPPGRLTFHLWKLHGSIDWYWSEGDRFGETVVRRPITRPALGDSAGIAGKRRFFAAPTATKTSYYGNEIIRHVWQRARSAIECASEIVLIGYSLPPTDLSVGSLLAGMTASRIVIVDPVAALVRQRLEALLRAGHDLEIEEVPTTREYVERAAEDFMRTQTTEVLNRHIADPMVPVLVGLSNAQYGQVTEVHRTESGMELSSPRWFEGIYEATSVDAPQGLNIGRLVGLLDAGTAVFVRGPDGRRNMIYDAVLHRQEIGRSDVWVQLQCQG